MSRPVAVIGFTADDDKYMLVVVALDPIDAYFNKDGKHLGHIREGKLALVKDATVSERESGMIWRCYQALRVALDNVKESS